MPAPLPIDTILPDLVATLRAKGQAVLQAPPGAGKTTRVPLALHEAGLTEGRILMLEPRRLAARAAAERLAEQLGETPGQTVGYRIRNETRVSPATRIEVVTEGILTRMLQSNAELTGVGAVLFDEFHERSLQADLGLALCLEIRAALREDLILLPMSATLDAAPVAALMGGAPVLTAEGRAYPVEIRHLDTPLPKRTRLEEATADLTLRAHAETTGSLLVFLPGEGEIRRTEALLRPKLPPSTALHPLFGAMKFAAQRAAIAPARTGRKIVLATAIAETSLTIDGITCVVDAGRARRARFDPNSGMSRLVTERVTRAEATQRTGRAGRLAPGACYRLWTKGEEGALASFPPAEIEAADLAPLALELALWGGSDLPFLTPPPEAAMAEARALLHGLGALDKAGRITAHGRAMARLPLHPRLAHMLLRAGADAAPLAALLSARDPLRGAPTDLALRLSALKDPRSAPGALNRGALEQIRSEARRLSKLAPATETPLSAAEAAALAYPDRIGLRRPGDAPRWLLSGGKGAEMAESDPLAGQRLLVATDLDGDPKNARIRQALPLSESELRGLFADEIGWEKIAEWSKRDRKVTARQQERFAALVLADRAWRDAPAQALAEAALQGVRQLGLPFSDAARRLQARALLYRAEGGEIADLGDDALLDSADTWLLPFLDGIRTAEDIRRLDLTEPLRQHIGWQALQRLDREMPAAFTTPMNRKVPIDYSGEAPEISVRVQEMFGTTLHPCVGPRRLPLRITLLSPAGRPVQTTMDLPGFWASSYADVRKDMRARYPKHPWPEDPTQADPTLRARPRR
ncbi:ATP-dependent helicase HrpB [Tropicimonas sp. IMCC6043]|uniref:ATP-dependent helicase HrpB n=1 Tax=Tropicimonas sp. IMCC6043 TaxID=2510645 RepID=UPI00101D3577|nr:ATP-dependent helicase HrpB [Tropicimonas sp. IMCC6043]RYH08635.1 ATP-dependent helicase HrpB [Tropicimonas sp. IMCC6043]